MKFKSLLCAAALGVGLLGASQHASAEVISLGFNIISNTTTTVDDAAASQFRVDISDTTNSSQVLFTFLNLGPITSSICDIYFDDGTPGSLFRINRLNNGTGVNFGVGASPGDLPGGNALSQPFSATSAQLTADSNPGGGRNGGTSGNGIGVGEQLGVVVDLISGKSWQDVKDSLARQFSATTSPLRIGLHVQSIGAAGTSAAYVTKPPTVVTTPPPSAPPAVPLPATLWAGLALMGGVGAKRLRRKFVRA